MNKIKIFLLSIVIINNIYSTNEQNDIDSWAKLKHGSYTIGYKSNLIYDFSRNFKDRVNYFGEITNKETARPILINIWYPSKHSTIYLRYEDYILSADLLFNKDRIEKNYAIKTYVESALEGGADLNLLSKLLTGKTRAVKDAYPLEGKFPLIIYAPSINSNPYENSIIIEFLVSHGFIIVSSPCIGYNSFDVSRDAIGLDAQTRDLAFILSYMINEKNLDKDNIGTLGFSWGGMSNILFALQDSRIGAVVSLDGAMNMKKYKKILGESDYYNINRMKAAYMQIIPNDQDRIMDFYDEAKYSNRVMFKYMGIEHNDFSSDCIMKYLHCSSEPTKRDANYINTVYTNICNYILNFFNAYLKNDKSSLDFINENDHTFIKDSELVFHQYKKALKAPPTEQEFLQLISENKIDVAISVYYELKTDDPEVNFFSENSIINLIYEFGPERANDLIKLLRINIDAYPKSSMSYFWMAQAYMAIDEIDKVEENLKIAVNIDPENKNALKLLEQILKR